MMYCDFYGLTQQPFGPIWDPKFAYFTPRIREVMDSMNAAVEGDVGLQLLLAKPGVGKTTLLQLLLQRYRASAKTALVSYTQCTPIELQRLIVQELGFDAEGDTVALLARLKATLAASQAEQRRVIIFIDEAQNLDAPVLETVRLLSNIESDNHRTLQIVISGQSELSEMLGRPRFTSLVQRISVIHRLAPFSTRETCGYIEHRLAAANYAGEPLFTEAACEAVAVESLGIPRNVNRICMNALSLGASAQRRKIDADVIRRVAGTLDVRAKDWLYPAGRESSRAAGFRTSDIHRPVQRQESPLLKQRQPAASMEFSRSAPRRYIDDGMSVAAEISRIHPELRPRPAARPSDFAHQAASRASARKRWGRIIDVVLSAAVLLLSLLVVWRWLPGSGNARANYSASPNTATRPADPPKAETEGAGAAQPSPTGSESVSPDAASKPPSSQTKDSKPRASGESAGGDGPALHPIRRRLEAKPAAPENFKVPSAVGGTVERIAPAPSLSLASTTSSIMPLQPFARPTPASPARTRTIAASSGPADDSPGSNADTPGPNERVVRTGVFPGVEIGEAGHVKAVESDEHRPGDAASVTAAPPVSNTTSRGDERVMLLHGSNPQYPDAARQMHVEGDVVLAAEVDGSGRVKHVRVVSGPRILATAAVNAVQQWRYKPFVNGQPASSMKQIVVQFRLSESR